MTEIETAYREGFTQGQWGEKRDADEAWNESEAKESQKDLATEREKVRKLSEAWKAEHNR